jgi:hypothetical protein
MTFRLDLRSASIGAAGAACALLLLLTPASATAAGGSEPLHAPVYSSAPAPSLAAMVNSWAQSFVDGRPNADTVYPTVLTPAPGGAATIVGIQADHRACNSFLLEIRSSAKVAAGSTIRTTVIDEVSVAMVRDADGVIRGHYYLGSSTCENSVFTR